MEKEVAVHEEDHHDNQPNDLESTNIVDTLHNDEALRVWLAMAVMKRRRFSAT